MTEPERILITTDGRHLRSQLARAIVKRLPDLAVECVGSFDDALVSVESTPPGAIVVDLATGGRRGLDMVMALRASRSGPHLLILCVTGNQPLRYQRQLRDAGADDCLPGHGDPEAVARCVAHTFEGRRPVTRQRVYGERKSAVLA